MSKEQTYWCVYDAGGKPLWHTLKTHKMSSKNAATPPNRKWNEIKQERSYTVQKVTINIVTK